jgi:hypothetical protein
LTADRRLETRMNIDFDGLDGVHLLGENAMRPPAPSSARHAALLIVAHASARPPHALPGAARVALTCASNCRIQVEAAFA